MSARPTIGNRMCVSYVSQAYSVGRVCCGVGARGRESDQCLCQLCQPGLLWCVCAGVGGGGEVGVEVGGSCESISVVWAELNRL